MISSKITNFNTLVDKIKVFHLERIVLRRKYLNYLYEMEQSQSCTI